MQKIVYAENFTAPTGSPIRELFPYLSRPDMISFAGGYPSATLFDTDGLEYASAEAMRDSRKVLQYGSTEGLETLRQRLLELSQLRGITAGGKNLLVTTGSQQAFDLIVRVMVNSGDSVALETPAYPAAIQALRLVGAQMHEFCADNSGLDTQLLEQHLLHQSGRQKPKLLYTVPNYSNPGGSLMSEERRRHVVELAITHEFMIVEDDPYGELNFTGKRLPTLYQIGRDLVGDANPVLYISSLSKTIAPALRIGWMLGPPELIRRCVIAKQTTDLCGSLITQTIAATYLGLNRYQGCVARSTQEYAKRMQTLALELSTRLGSRVCFQKPQGGLFLWVRLAEGIDPERLFQAAVDSNVLFVPGAAFYPTPPKLPAIRLSFANTTIKDIESGVARLQNAFDILGSHSAKFVPYEAA